MAFCGTSRKLFVALVFLASCMSLVAQKHVKHDPKKQARAQIEAAEEQWRTAQLNVDVAAMDKLLSDDYLGITGSGEVVTKLQQLDRMRTRTVVLTKLEISDIKIKLIGQIAIVNSHAEVEGQNDKVSINGEYRYTRVYQHLPGGAWKITSFEITRIPKQRRQKDDSELPPRP